MLQFLCRRRFVFFFSQPLFFLLPVFSNKTGIPSSAASSLTLILSGKTLRDDSVTINGDDDGSGGSSSSVKISESTRVLVLRGGSAPPASAPPAAAALEARLEALKAAAEKLVAGNGSRGSGGELVIETQDGGGSDALAGLPEADARAIKLGLTLAAKGSASLDEARKVMRERNRGEEGNGSGPPSTSSVSAAAAAHVSARRQRMRQRATEALAELDIASQALSLIAASSAPSSASSPHSAAQQLLRRADNVALLHLDWAWAAYLAGEPARLAAAAQKLKEARRALEAAAAASRGRDRSRARAEIGDGGGSTSSSRGGGGGGPEGALRVRLDLLEGIAAAASGRGASGEAAALLSRAAQGWLSWQAPSAASVDALVEMGFLRSEARRALRFVGGTGGRRGNLDAAAAAAADMRRASGAADSASTNKRSAAAAAGGGGSSRVEHRAQKAARRAEATTEGGKPIDAGVVSQLMALGFDPNLAAAAAATNDNNLDAALDALSDVESNLTLQTSVEERKKRRKEEMKEGGGEDDDGGEEERGGGGGSGGDGDDDDENEDNETAPAPEAEGAERALLESLEAQRPSDPLAASLEVELDLEGSALVTWLRRLGRGEEAEELVRAGAKEEED